MLLYSWDGGLDVCVDLTKSSHLTQIGIVDFVPDRAIIDVAQRKSGKYMDRCAAIGYGFLPFSFSSLEELEADARKRCKYMAKCAAIGYGFLSFSFSSLGELEADAVTLLKRIRKFFMTQDIGTRASVHIFDMISFTIAKEWEL
nr:hypothetical protein [Tanacetum cinerariifolium]